MKTEKVVKKGQPMGLDFFEFRSMSFLTKQP